MGRALALGIGPSIVSAEALAGDVVTKIIWPRMGEQPRVIDAGAGAVTGGGAIAESLPATRPAIGASSDVAGAIRASTEGAPAAADATPTGAPDVDGAQVASELRSERLAANAGFGHPHAASGCGFCRRAAAAYR